MSTNGQHADIRNCAICDGSRDLTRVGGEWHLHCPECDTYNRVSQHPIHAAGERLPNGALVLASKPIEGYSGAAVYLADTGEGPTRYVTWAAYNGPRSTGNGHYYDSLSRAARDFDSRGE